MKTSTAYLVVLVAAALISIANAQASFGDLFPGFSQNLPPQNLVAASGSSGRSNTAGPVLFPMSPAGSETSGVVVGASGFGFVPPGGRQGGGRGVYQYRGRLPFPQLTAVRPAISNSFSSPPLWRLPLRSFFSGGPSASYQASSTFGDFL